MAGANLPAKMYKKKSPTVLRLSFEGTGGETQFIDIAKALSIINRKFYRQGVYYYVNSVEAYNNSNAVIDLHTLPDNWVTKNAWNRGFRMFQKMNALVDTPRPKYHDFKVYMSYLHMQTGSLPPKLFNVNSVGHAKNADEWAYSQFTSGNDDGDGVQEADNWFVHMLGPHVSQITGSAATDSSNFASVGLIKSYSETRPEPDQSGSPIVPVNAELDPIQNIFDMSSEDMVDDLVERLDEDNDETPYDADTYIGEYGYDMQHVARLATSEASGRVAKASGFCAPLGLICIDPQETQGADDWRIVINLAQGTYHGVYAERC